MKRGVASVGMTQLLSSNAQDFIEDRPRPMPTPRMRLFLSSNAQDFIEERPPSA